MKAQVVVEFDSQTRLLKISGKGDPLLVLTALDLAHARLLHQLENEPKRVLEPV